MLELDRYFESWLEMHYALYPSDLSPDAVWEYRRIFEDELKEHN
jgi:hypothetical protein